VTPIISVAMGGVAASKRNCSGSIQRNPTSQLLISGDLAVARVGSKYHAHHAQPLTPASQIADMASQSLSSPRRHLISRIDPQPVPGGGLPPSVGTTGCKPTNIRKFCGATWSAAIRLTSSRVSRWAPVRLPLEMDLVERLPVGVADDKAGVGSFEAAFLFPFEAELAERKYMAGYRITLKRDASYFDAANVAI
jgi:hypothetical protein